MGRAEAAGSITQDRLVRAGKDLGLETPSLCVCRCGRCRIGQAFGDARTWSLSETRRATTARADSTLERPGASFCTVVAAAPRHLGGDADAWLCQSSEAKSFLECSCLAIFGTSLFRDHVAVCCQGAEIGPAGRTRKSMRHRRPGAIETKMDN